MPPELGFAHLLGPHLQESCPKMLRVHITELGAQLKSHSDQDTDWHLSKEPWVSISSSFVWRVCGLRGAWGAPSFESAKLWGRKNP